MDLQSWAEYYFFDYEIERAKASPKPVEKLISLAQKNGRRCLAHGSNHSYETTSKGEVLFFVEGNNTRQKIDYRATIKQLAQSLFIEQKQFNLFE